MPQTLTVTQIQRLTGMSPSALKRALRHFATAKSGRGRYDVGDPRLAAWLRHRELESARDAAPDSRGRDVHDCSTAAPFVALPSGIPLPRAEWATLRGADESAAQLALARLVGEWRLPPHAEAPDNLPRDELRLPGGAVVNRHQFHRLRNGSDVQAAHALDILLRSHTTQ